MRRGLSDRFRRAGKKPERAMVVNDEDAVDGNGQGAPGKKVRDGLAVFDDEGDGNGHLLPRLVHAI